MEEQTETLSLDHPNPKLRTVADLALAAIDVLEARGWCSGAHVRPDGRVCVEGAINAAAYGDPEPHGPNRDSNFETPAVMAFATAAIAIVPEIRARLNVEDGNPTCALWSWNDSHGSLFGFGNDPEKLERRRAVIEAAMRDIAAATENTPLDLAEVPA